MIFVLGLFVYIVLCYCDKFGNKVLYWSDWDDSKCFEFIWWGIFIIIIGILGFVMVKMMYDLVDLLKKDVKLLIIEVIFFDWKWLF